MRILFLCTGNICRSPVAEVILRHRLDRLGIPAVVASAGVLEGGVAASGPGVDVMAAQGFDLSGHRSQPMTAELLSSADLLVAMAREHVREAVVHAPHRWPRTFTLKELVRRGRKIGARGPGESLDQWLARAHDGRSTRELMGASPDDDVADPIGRPRAEYERMVNEVTDLVDEMVRLLWESADDELESRETERAS